MGAVAEDGVSCNLFYTSIRTPGGTTGIPIYTLGSRTGKGIYGTADVGEGGTTGDGPCEWREPGNIGGRDVESLV
jgi:hypothetical protein